MHSHDTIAAISTPPGMGAIAVVRMSGPDAFQIASMIFCPGTTSSKEPVGSIGQSARLPSAEGRTDWISHFARVGFIRDPDSGVKLDEVVIIPYKGPRTYTGEDLVEINCHGGWLIPNELLALCLRYGARLSRPGEFTQRAFLSGRIDLTQAEAVLDLIQAKTSQQGRLALSALSGQLGEKILAVRAQLVSLLAQVVAAIDFPEEVGETGAEEISSTVSSCLTILRDLSGTARSGRFLREGLRLAIVGRPNAGKSSLLNQLLRFERAIVTDVPGTTRDSLEELIDLNGLPVILVDTAGIRPTDDQVEKIGIERTLAAIIQADMVLFMLDLGEGWAEPEDEVLQLIGTRPFILVGNKVDLLNSNQMPLPKIAAASSIAVSAKTGSGLPELTGAIERWAYAGQSGRELQPSLNARQSELCSKASDSLALVEEALAMQLPQDCLSTDLKSAVDALSEICGEAVSEEIIHKVFASFCIGK
jgi:tRNA modification GTPase